MPPLWIGGGCGHKGKKINKELCVQNVCLPMIWTGNALKMALEMLSKWPERQKKRSILTTSHLVVLVIINVCSQRRSIQYCYACHF